MVTIFTAVVSAVLIVSNAFLLALAKQPHLTLSISEVTSCPEYRNLPNRFDKIRLRVDPTDGDLYVNSDVTIKEALNDPTALRADFYKCVTKEEPSCQIYKTIERSTICEDIGKEKVVWTSILDSIQGFEDVCPVKPGFYKMVDAPLTKAIRDNVALNKGHWRMKISLLKGGKVIGCHKGYGEVKPKRRSKNPNKSKDDDNDGDYDDGNDDGDEGKDSSEGVSKSN